MKKSELKSIIMECIEEMEHGMGKLVKKFDKSQDKFKKAKKAGGDPTDPSMSPKLYKDYQKIVDARHGVHGKGTNRDTKRASDKRQKTRTINPKRVPDSYRGEKGR